MYGHIIKVRTHFNVKLPAISGHLPNADADSHLLVVSTWYNGQCKQMPRFRWSFQPEIVTDEQYVTSSGVINHMIAANQPLHWLRLFYDTTSEKSRLLFFQLAMSKKITILSLDQGIEVLCRMGEAHHIERLLPSQCGKNANGSYDIKTDTGKAIVAYVDYKYSPTVCLQYLSCYVALILVLITIAYLIMTMHVFSMNTAGGDSSR